MSARSLIEDAASSRPQLQRLVEKHKGEKSRITIEANRGMTFGDMIPVLQAVEEAEIETIAFVGSYAR